MPNQHSIFDATPWGYWAALAYFGAHGQASAHDLAQACGMDTAQAAVVIGGLVLEGKLVVVEADNEARRYWQEYRLAETEDEGRTQ